MEWKRNELKGKRKKREREMTLGPYRKMSRKKCRK